MFKFLTNLTVSLLLPAAASVGTYLVFCSNGTPQWLAGIIAAVVAFDLVIEGPVACEDFFEDNAGKQLLVRDGVRFVARHIVVSCSAFTAAVIAYLAFPLLLPSGRQPLVPELQELTPSVWGRVKDGWATILSRFQPEHVRDLRYVAAILAWLFVTLIREAFRKLDAAEEEDAPGHHHRGRRLLSETQAKKAAVQATPKGDPGIPWGGILLPSSVANLNFLAVGAPGSGKTVTIQTLAGSVLRDLGKGRGVRALFFDAKQDLLSKVAGMGLPYKSMHVHDRRGVAWRMGADLRACDCDTVAAILAPPNKHASQPFFDDAARVLMAGAIDSFIEVTPGAWEFYDLIHCMGNAGRLIRVLERTALGRDLIDIYFAKAETAKDVMSTVANKMAPYRTVAAAWQRAKESISLNDWLANEYVLVLGNSNVAKEAVKAVNRVIFQRLAQLLLDLPNENPNRTWLFLDELRQAGTLLPGLSDVALMGRTKNVILVIGAQDVEGVQEEYGEKQANELFGMCALKAILRVESPQTANWASDVIGEREEYEYHRSITWAVGGGSEGESEQLVKREAVLPAEFLNLPPTCPENGLTGYFLSPGVGAWKASIPWPMVVRGLVKPDASVPDFVPREDDELKLVPWTDEDLARLKISAEPQQEQKESKVVELAPRRRMKAAGMKKPRNLDH